MRVGLSFLLFINSLALLSQPFTVLQQTSYTVEFEPFALINWLGPGGVSSGTTNVSLPGPVEAGLALPGASVPMGQHRLLYTFTQPAGQYSVQLSASGSSLMEVRFLGVSSAGGLKPVLGPVVVSSGPQMVASGNVGSASGTGAGDGLFYELSVKPRLGSVPYGGFYGGSHGMNLLFAVP